MSASNPDPETGLISLFDPAFAACPQPVYRRALSRCPVTRAAFTNSPVISRYEDVVWCLRHPEVFSSEMSLALALGTERPMIPQQIDPPAQTRYRRLLDPHFSRRKMEALVPSIRSSAISFCSLSCMSLAVFSIFWRLPRSFMPLHSPWLLKRALR